MTGGVEEGKGKKNKEGLSDGKAGVGKEHRRREREKGKEWGILSKLIVTFVIISHGYEKGEEEVREQLKEKGEERKETKHRCGSMGKGKHVLRERKGKGTLLRYFSKTT